MALSERVSIRVSILIWGISRSVSFINGCCMDNAMDSGHDDEGRESCPAETAEVWTKYNRSGIVAVTIYKSCEYLTKDWHLLRIEYSKAGDENIW